MKKRFSVVKTPRDIQKRPKTAFTSLDQLKEKKRSMAK